MPTPATSTATPSTQKSTTDRSDAAQLPPAPPGVAWVGRLVRAADAISPRWGARLAANLFLTSRRRPAPARELTTLAGATRATFTVGPWRLAAWTWGESGPPVLLVHGWDGRSSQLGELAQVLASAGFRAVAVDMPAHGENTGKRTNLLEFAAAVTGLAQQLGPLAGVVAHSFGAAATTVALGATANTMALRQELAIDKLVYLAPGEDFGHFTANFGRWLGLSASLVTRMQQNMERRFGTPWAELRGHLLAPRMSRPLLVIHDDQDLDVPLSHGQTYAERWLGARLITTHGLGHRRILREPAVVRAVVEFLR